MRALVVMALLLAPLPRWRKPLKLALAGCTSIRMAAAEIAESSGRRACTSKS